MVYYRSMRAVRGAISRRIKIFTHRDTGLLSGYIELLHKRSESEVLELLNNILHNIHDYYVKTQYNNNKGGYNVTTIYIKQLSELAGPIPAEFLTKN